MTTLSPDAWFGVGCDLLLSQGPRALTVERLCRAAGVTKGSFYHHFADAAVFRERLADHLVLRSATEPVSTLEAIASPAQRLSALVELIAASNTALDAAMRRWAAVDPQIAARVREVDSQRHTLVAQTFAQLFPDEPQRAHDLTRLSEAFYLGATLLEPPVTGDEYRRLARLLTAARRARR